MLKSLIRYFGIETADAHCDVPCGIYDIATATVAAETVAVLTKKILDLPVPTKPEEVRAYQNTVTRMVWTKEEHARICKNEITILWTDFFKPQHLELFPDLHTTFWNAAKLVSFCKVNVDLAKAEELRKVVAHLGEMLAKAKAAAKK